jgi:hypothetical protein
VVTVTSIVVYGATGYTGRMIVEELGRRGLPIVLAGRNGPELERLGRELGERTEIRRASVDDPSSLRAMLSGATVLVNAAGPFSVTGRPLVEAAIEAGCHYLDIGADAFVMKALFEDYDASARRAGSIVLPGASFYFVLSDLLSHFVAEGRGRLDSVEIGYALDSWNFTPGSRAAFWDMVGRRLVFEDGALHAVTRNPPGSTFHFSEPMGKRRVFAYPGGEVVTVPRHVSAANVSVAMTARTFAPAWALWAFPAVLAIVSAVARSSLGPVLRRASLSAPRRDLEVRRAAAKFTVEVHARAGTQVWVGAIRGRHMYRLGAWLAADAAARIAAGEIEARGVLAPSQAFDARPYLSTLLGNELISSVRLPDELTRPSVAQGNGAWASAPLTA